MSATSSNYYGSEGYLRVLAQARFGAAWYQDSRDGNICRVGRYDAQGNREILGRGRDWQTAIDRAEVTLQVIAQRGWNI